MEARHASDRGADAPASGEGSEPSLSTGFAQGAPKERPLSLKTILRGVALTVRPDGVFRFLLFGGEPSLRLLNLVVARECPKDVRDKGHLIALTSSFGNVAELLALALLTHPTRRRVGAVMISWYSGAYRMRVCSASVVDTHSPHQWLPAS
jgi:hypothetical protein